MPVRRTADGLFLAGSDQPFPWQPPGGEASRWLAGFRPSDVMMSRDGSGLACRVKRASFLGAMIDYLIEVEGSLFRTQVETHEALARALVLGETEPCRAAFHDIHWFEDRESQEGR